MNFCDRKVKRTGITYKKPKPKGDYYPCISCGEKGYTSKGKECGFCNGIGWAKEDTMLDRPNL